MLAKYPYVTVQLSGEDGNIFVIIGRVRRALRKAGVKDEELNQFSDEVASTGSYDEALRKVMEWVDVE